MSKILDSIQKPDDVRDLSFDELGQLAQELREEMIAATSVNGGHLASSLGAVEIILAAHRVLHLPEDKLLFDVGHQAYAHKLLTGRRSGFAHLRKEGGVSGFTRRMESPYDVHDAGHASDALPTALGLALARDIEGLDTNIVTVVGDASIAGGLSYEALNYIGQQQFKRFVVILNDNEMSISRSVGAFSSYLAGIRTSKAYTNVRDSVEEGLSRSSKVGDTLVRLGEKAKEATKQFLIPGMFFEDMGFTYLGPVDGHDVRLFQETLVRALSMGKPVVIHAVTKKGLGYAPAQANPEAFHGVAPFDIATGEIRKPKGGAPTYTSVFSQRLIAEVNPCIVAITAAMPAGTGLDAFAKRFPRRFFDVGIAEECAVTMASGLAIGQFVPVVAVYSTFLQRAYDQIVHDVCLQNLPVCILSDHVGLVGDDGKTHHGVLSVPMLMSIPNLTLLAPRDTRQIRQAVRATLKLDGPCVVQYPKEGIEPYAQNVTGEPFAVGKWQTLIPGGQDAVILAYGRMTQNAIQASELLVQRGLSVGVIDCCSLKPLDMDCLRALFERKAKIVTIEEGEMIGGFGSEIARVCVEENADAPMQIIGLENRFITHGSVPELLRECGLMPEQLANRIEEIAGDKESSHVG